MIRRLLPDQTDTLLEWTSMRSMSSMNSCAACCMHMHNMLACSNWGAIIGIASRLQIIFFVGRLENGKNQPASVHGQTLIQRVHTRLSLLCSPNRAKRYLGEAVPDLAALNPA